MLWYFSDTTASVNTGDELALQAPAKAKPRRHRRRPRVVLRLGRQAHAGVAGAVVQGEDEATTDAQGRATLATPDRGTLRLRAEHGADIPSQTVSVCITAKPRCPSRRGKRIFGTAKADRIAGTKGPDTVSAGSRRRPRERARGWHRHRALREGT